MTDGQNEITGSNAMTEAGVTEMTGDQNEVAGPTAMAGDQGKAAGATAAAGDLHKAIVQAAPFLQTHLLYLAYAGSRSYGTATEDSDIDLRGIAFAPREAVFGLSVYEQTILDVPDVVVYSLRKYARLALKANPNILELLYVEPELVLVCNSWGSLLREQRALFLSRQVFHSFGGYAIHHLRRLAELAAGNQTGQQPAYDGKDASHLIRLLQTGTELLRSGHLHVRRSNWQELMAIKRGEWLLTDIVAYAEHLYREMEQAYRQTKLPERPDTAAIEALLIRCNEEFYCR